MWKRWEHFGHRYQSCLFLCSRFGEIQMWTILSAASAMSILKEQWTRKISLDLWQTPKAIHRTGLFIVQLIHSLLTYLFGFSARSTDLIYDWRTSQIFTQRTPDCVSITLAGGAFHNRFHQIDILCLIKWTANEFIQIFLARSHGPAFGSHSMHDSMWLSIDSMNSEPRPFCMGNNNVVHHE